MSNHTNRATWPFRVRLLGTEKPFAAFFDRKEAESYASWLSSRSIYWDSVVEVGAVNGTGLVSRYTKGELVK